MDRRDHERDQMDEQLLDAAERGYKLAKIRDENDKVRNVYQFNRLHFNLALIVQFLVWAVGIYANYAVTQQRVALLEKQMEQTQTTQTLILEKLNRIEVDISWLKDARDRSGDRERKR